MAVFWFGPHRVTDKISYVGPFPVEDRRINLWKFSDVNELLCCVDFLEKNAVTADDLKGLIGDSLPIRKTNIVSLKVVAKEHTILSGPGEEDLAFPIFYVTPGSWRMKVEVVNPTVDQVPNPVETGKWGIDVCYAAYDAPLKRGEPRRIVSRAEAIERALGSI